MSGSIQMKKVMSKFLSVALAVSVVMTCFTAAAFADTTTVGVSYSAHVQDIGWQATVSDGATAGTSGQGKRIEALKVSLTNAPAGAHINYQVHVQDHGWMTVASDGAPAGTTGENKRIEAIALTISGAAGYSIDYRVHVQDIGWMDWVSGGSIAGTVGQSKRIEAIQIKVTPDTVRTFSITPAITLTANGETRTITTTTDTASEVNIIWMSDNTGVATVSNGIVTAVASGTAIITASLGGETAACVVNVTNTPDTRSTTNLVTFTENNSLAGVSIQIMSSDDGSYYQTVITNENGVARIHLPDGKYFIKALAVGYSLSDTQGFTVSSASLQYDFTMVDQGQDYTVTFAEAASLRDVDLQVYSYSINYIATLSTDSSGTAAIDLPDGNYMLGANIAGYDTFICDFAVDSAPETVDFAMASTPTKTLPYYEDFTDTINILPTGWRTNYPTNWAVHNAGVAGGSSPELMLNYDPWFKDSFMAITPAIDASASDGLQLTFKQYLDHYDTPYSIQVRVSTDGGVTWGDPVWSIEPTGNVGPQTVAVDLSAYDGQTINLAWVLVGNSYNIDNWNIDDISVTSNQPLYVMQQY